MADVGPLHVGSSPSTEWSRPPEVELSRGWWLKLDPGCGQYYFCNSETQESQWTLPPDLDDWKVKQTTQADAWRRRDEDLRRLSTAFPFQPRWFPSKEPPPPPDPEERKPKKKLRGGALLQAIQQF